MIADYKHNFLNFHFDFFRSCVFKNCICPVLRELHVRRALEYKQVKTFENTQQISGKLPNKLEKCSAWVRMEEDRAGHPTFSSRKYFLVKKNGEDIS